MPSAPPPGSVPPSPGARPRYVRARGTTLAVASQVVAELRRLADQGRILMPELAALPQRSALAGRSAAQQVAQGLLQPLHAVRLLLGHRDLLAQALLPALLLLSFCLGVGFLDALFSHARGILGPMLRSGLGSFVALAPVPSILMANHYGRLCAQAHERLQLGPCRPRRMPLMRSALLALRQVVVVAVALAPLSFVVHLVPWIGKWVAHGLLLLWALHWIVVEALDDGCVDGAPESQPAAEPLPATPWVPWFLGPMQRVGAAFPGFWGAPLRWFVRRACWLCGPWRKEITLIEHNLPVMLGFAATTAALLCTPVLNLVFRPITVVAAVRLMGQLRGLGPRPAAIVVQDLQPPAGSC